MDRTELCLWLGITDDELDRLLARGLPSAPGSRYNADAVAAWLQTNGLAEATEPELPPGVVKTQRELAARLERSRPTIAAWLDAGAPGREGHYDVAAVKAWRDERDRQLKRPTSYGTPANVASNDVAELRELVRKELLDHNGLIIGVLQAAFDAIEAKLPEIAKDPQLKSDLLKASFDAAMPFIVGKDQLEAAVEARVESVLKLVS